MKSYRISIIFIFVIGSLALKTIGKAPYHDSLCTLQSPYIIPCDSFACIFQTNYNGIVKSIPLNVSRFPRDYFSFCKQSYVTIKPTAIIYIMDLSGSMYRYNGQTVQYPDPGWENVGDPYRLRDDALECGFSTQQEKMPHSLAGYIGFGSNVILDNPRFRGNHVLPLTDVTDSVSKFKEIVTLLKNDLESGPEGTNYLAPLNYAIEWFKELQENYIKAIVFISDGEPNSGLEPSSGQIDTLINNKIVVHGIHLGTGTSNILSNLCTATNGTYSLVTPNNMEYISQVVERIVVTTSEPLRLKSASVLNKSLKPSMSSSLSFIEEINDSMSQVYLNNFIPLQIGPNEMVINAAFETESGSFDTSRADFFYIDVSNDEPPCSCHKCWHRAGIQLLDSNTAIDTLTTNINAYTIDLAYYANDTLPTTKVIVKTVSKGDCDTISIQNSGWDGEKWIFSGIVPFTVTTTAPILGNKQTESSNNDLIMLSWTHPRDIRDTAADTIIVNVDNTSLNAQSPLVKGDIKIHAQNKLYGLFIRIQFPTIVDNVEASLVSLDGRVMCTKQGIKTNRLHLTSNNISNGMYLIRINSKDQVVYKKICLIQ